ncbi:MAG: translocation/assembly module TamB [Muribaculaceae bacterium]|nr:translocation/assembly module TamB [Muribaculaceae bacterium]
MNRIVWRRLINGVAWFVAGVLILAGIALTALYVPGVIGRVAGWVLPAVERSSGMSISVEDISLKFPLRVSVERALVLEASGDTLASARHIDVSVNPLPLLKGDVSVMSAGISDAVYRMGGVDSMYLRADIGRADISSVTLNLLRGIIDVDYAGVDGAKVDLVIGQDTAVASADTTASSPLMIKARRIELKNLDYTMSMLPVIDSLGAHVGTAVLRDGLVDMDSRIISATALMVDSVKAVYLTPSTQYLADHPQKPDETAAAEQSPSSGPMWRIDAWKVSLTRSEAVYGVAGAVPQPGLDMNYLQARDIDIVVDSFYNRGAEIRVPLRRLSATERSGLQIDASGVFAMDSSAMRASEFSISTLYSSIDLDAVMGLASPGDTLANDLPVRLDAKASVGLQDLAIAVPSLSAVIDKMPRRTPITADVSLDGTMQDLKLQKFDLAMQRCFDISASGNVAGWNDINTASGRVRLNGHIIDPGVFRPTVEQARLGMAVNIPPLSLSGDASMDRGTIEGRVNAVTSGGRLAMDARWNGRAENYRLAARLDSFPVRAFLPDLGISTVTARADVQGSGLDMLSPRSRVVADIHVDRILYDNRAYGNIDFAAIMADGTAHASLRSSNPAADLSVTVAATVSKNLYTWDMTGDVRRLDLYAMGMTDTVMGGAVSLASEGSYAPASGDIDATLDVEHLDWNIGASHLVTARLSATFSSADTMTRATVDNRQLAMRFSSPAGLDRIMAGITAASDTLNRQIAGRRIDAAVLQHTLPVFDLSVVSGADNLINDYLAPDRLSFRNLSVDVSNDSVMHADAGVYGFKSGDDTRLDSISVDIRQHGDKIVLAAMIDNRPGTMDDFAHVRLDGFAAGNIAGVYVRQRDIGGRTGYSLGLEAGLSDSVASLSFKPLDPVIAYKNWAVNDGNYITYNFYTKHIDADLDMSGDGSRLRLYTEHNDSTAGQEDLILNISDVKLSDWLAISPFAPPIKGTLSADMRLRYDSRSLNGSGTVGLKDLTYGRDRVGDFDLGVDLRTTTSGVVNAEVALMVDGIKTITAIGALNDSTKANPFDLDFSMIRLPLRIVNPFLPVGTARLSGMLNGTMQITGTLAEPVFNGYIDFDSAAVNVTMLGTDFHFSEKKVEVVDNIVNFDGYTITGANENPLTINGSVDMTALASPKFDLSMAARNMQVVKGDKRKNVDVYGNAYVNLDATVKGNMSFMDVDAAVTLLRSTNVTYVMTEASPQSLALRQSDDMVRFVNFSDSIAVMAADTVADRGMAMRVDAVLTVDPGSTINVNLSPDGSNKVQILGNGTLNYSLSPFGDSRVTGRFNIDKGFVRYTPPLISEKLFSFRPDSYIAFNGDMLNPILSVYADETLRANVTREGENSRLVNFTVGLSVTGTLENMNVAFDLSTKDDITVQNELQAMSAEQRANQAMNMLLYNVYTGPGTKGNSNLAGNPLYSFLESQINTWAANNIKGVDVSFGIDQYDRTRDGSTSSTTSYSYRVSKSLFNDRFKIVVGGNYSTDADADENFSQNLINDISFEYMLNRSGSMLVRLFRHTGYESILEGEITQTGVGFVYKRQLRRLGDMFRFLRPRRKEEPAPVSAVQQPDSATLNDDDNETE